MNLGLRFIFWWVRCVHTCTLYFPGIPTETHHFGQSSANVEKLNFTPGCDSLNTVWTYFGLHRITLFHFLIIHPSTFTEMCLFLDIANIVTNFKEQNNWEAYNHTDGEEIPCLLWNLKVLYCGHKHPLLVLILSQMHQVHTFPPYFTLIELCHSWFGLIFGRSPFLCFRCSNNAVFCKYLTCFFTDVLLFQKYYNLSVCYSCLEPDSVSSLTNLNLSAVEV